MDIAGASAQTEYEELHRIYAGSRPYRARTMFPRILALAITAFLVSGISPQAGLILTAIGGVAIAKEIWGTPQAIRAWAKGAQGERLTAGVLRKAEKFGYVSLHDRQVPGSKANLDHIAIGPGGIFVIETKNYSAKIGVGTHTLFIGGRARPNLVNQAWREAATVQRVLAPLVARLEIDAQPVLCFHGAQISQPGASVQGVRIVGARTLLRLLKKAPPLLSPTDIRRVHHMADVLLKPAHQSPAPDDPLAHRVLAPGS